MKYAVAVALVFLLAGCGPKVPVASPATKVIYQEVVKEVKRPCPVKVPVQPSRLERPLPTDPGALTDILIIKLEEWAGEGGYGEKAKAALDVCTRP